MQLLASTDLFATKGVEYLLVISFLTAFVLFWLLLRRPVQFGPVPALATSGVRTANGWFRLGRGSYYHPGHTWARPGADGMVTVGVDDFAQKLIGRADAIDLPRIGAQVRQGERGSSFRVATKSVDVLAPIDGRVVQVNQAVLENPELVNQDPYGEGWLLKIAPERLSANIKGLLHGRLASVWLGSKEDALRKRISGDLGTFLQDGGVPVSGIARAIDADRWDEIAREFLLS